MVDGGVVVTRVGAMVVGVVVRVGANVDGGVVARGTVFGVAPCGGR